MSLIRWDPWRELEKARRELDRLFDRVLEKTRGGEGWLGGGWPSVDVYERGGDVVVEIELPGVDPENIRLEVNEDSVFVEAERREDKETQGEGLYRRVRRFGRVSRRIPLPTAVKADQARARYRNGLLEVTIPRAEGGGGRRVPIETD